MLPYRFFLDDLVLENWRCYEHQTLTLNPEFTLLIGTNASGKTSLLDAIAVSIAGLLWDLPSLPQTSKKTIEREDVRFAVHHTGRYVELLRKYPCALACHAVSGADRLDWDMQWVGEQKRIKRHYSRGLNGVIQGWQTTLQNGGDDPLPVFAYYGTGRLWSLKREKKGAQKTPQSALLPERSEGYVDCLDPASNVKQLTSWMRQQTYAQLQLGQPLPQLQTISKAVATCLGEPVERLYFDVRADDLYVTWRDGSVFPLSVLSDGFRTVIGMVADIAWRAVVLNPGAGEDAAANASGVVLIDELDLHLHPAWQRRVIADLRRTFPCMQFIVTTHSPQVIASAKREWVQVLSRDGAVAPLTGYVEGRDSNAILVDIMGDRERPASAEEPLQYLHDMISAQKFGEADALLATLEKKLGHDDTELVRARWLMEWEGGGDASDQEGD